MGDTYEAALLTDYPWTSLGSKFIIDAGGGQGGLVLPLARILPECKFLIQELPEVVPLARRNVERYLPGALQDGRIRLQAHNLFRPQPEATRDTIYILRYVLYDWSGENCIKVLQNIQSVARPECKILIIESVVVPATVPRGIPMDNNGPLQFPSPLVTYKPTTAPNFFPADFGANAKMPLALGVHLMDAFNAYERTLMRPMFLPP